jgi:carbonic anhydrase
VHTLEQLLSENKTWAAEKHLADPSFFSTSAKEQKPEILWIGCSDSRVPAEVITNAEPGEMFIHRNIANQVIATDFNSLSVLQYAVHVLEIKHIIVCGHQNCGGVRAALSRQNHDLNITNKWLMHIKQIYRLHQDELDAQPSDEARINRLIELNVLEQVQTLAHTSIIQKAWAERKAPSLHGWVYGLSDGLLQPLVTLEPGCEIHPIFQYDSLTA